MTTILESGWENSGGSDVTDNAAWDNSSGTPTISSATKKTGSYALSCNATSTYVYKQLASAYSDLFLQFDVYFSSLPTVTDDSVNLCRLADVDWNNSLRVYVEKTSGGLKWALYSGGTYYYYLPDSAITTGVWYRIQLRRKVGAGNGVGEVYINGVKRIEQTAETVTNNGQVVIVGTVYSAESETVVFDNVKASDVLLVDYYPYIQQISNIDSTADIGTHSSFAAQQAAADSTYDTLTEADTDTGTSQLGDTSGSGTSYRTTAANEMRLFSIQAANTGQVDSIVFYGRGNASAQNCKGIVTDSSGNLLTNGVGDAVSVSTTAGNKTLTFTNKPLVTAGATYWFGVVTAGAVRIYYDSTTGGTNKQDTTNSYTTPTSPTDAGNTTETWRVMYANITELNYQLQLEEQFTDIPAGDHGLQITTGAFSSPAETLYVQVWDAGGSTWTTLGSLTASTTNPLGNITSYISSGNLYIRFLSGTETDDNIQSTWQIDSVFLTDIYTKTFTLNAELAAGATTYTKTFTVGANLLQNLTKACTVNANLLQNLTKTFTAGSNLLAQYTKIFTVNGNLLANLTKTFTVNGGLLQNYTKTFTVNSNLLAAYTKTFTANANLLGVYTVPFTANANLTANLTKTFTVNGNLLQNQTKAFTVNSNLLANLTKAFTYSGDLSGNYTKTFTYNAELLSGSTQTFTVDGNLTETNLSNFTYNALLQLAEVPVTETQQAGVYAKYEPPVNFTLLKLLLKYFESKP